MPASTAPPTGTVTFLFTDIEGSTKLWEQHPDAMRPALARHDQLLRQSIEGQGGFVFKTVGDAFCAAFWTANQALAAALASQTALGAEAWALPTPLLVRMALHTGSAEERGGDYFGPPLNRVARLMAAGHGSQTLLSEVTQGLVRDSLPLGVTLQDLGRHRLKDLGRPEQVFQLQNPDLVADFPPLRSLDNPDLPNNLPQQTSSFIGRETQVAEVKGLLGETRLLTLTGAGGSGKTRLSLQVAADLLTGDGDGVWLVELAALTDPDLVPQAVAAVLGVPEEAGKTIRQALVDWLKPKRLLLILDNCEHLVAACADLAAALLRDCPGVHLLASSREPLNVVGEQTYRVPPLTLPDPTQTQTVDTLSQYEAVRLFIDRARAVLSAFAVTNANAPAVAQVCFRLDGIPLAIELAAARIRSLPIDEINTRLGDRFRLLTGGARTALPRQQTLRALIDWSYDLLTDAEKTLLCRLSVFAGGWTLAAAEDICGAEEADVLDLLTSLVDKSLVLYEQEDGDGGRYRLLETVRQYADDRLRESREAEAIQDRAASWFLHLAEDAEPKLRGRDQAAWLSRLATEHDNLRASLAWFEKRDEQSESGAENSLRLAGALWRFWKTRGHFSEGRQWLSRALKRTGEPAARAKALNRAGILACDQGEYLAAAAFLEESLTLYRELEDQNGVADALNHLGIVAESQGDPAAARDLFEESLELYRQEGDQHAIAVTLSNLGIMAEIQGDNASARTLYEESLLLRRQLEDDKGIADSLNNLGAMASEQGDNAAARTLYEESLTFYRRIGDQQGIAVSLHNLGRVASEQGDSVAAQALLEESLLLRRSIGNKEGIILVLEEIAGMLQRLGQSQRAARLVGATSAARALIGSPWTSMEQGAIDKVLFATRVSLGDAAFEAAWNAGREMTSEQAVEYALAWE